MASAANSLRLCLRQACRPLPTARAARPALATPIFAPRRPLSTTTVRRAEKDDAEEDSGEAIEDVKTYENPGQVLKDMLHEEGLSAEDRQLIKDNIEIWNQLPRQQQEKVEELRRDIRAETSGIRYLVKPKKGSFWNEDEKDTDLITDEIGEDDFEEDDMLSIAHAKLEEHREAREYARLAVWEMPLLSKLAKPFEPPTESQPLRFRYTSYMGEFHPAERKVVVEFSPSDLVDLNEAQQLKLTKLAGPRYNPGKGLIKMSCDRFEHQAQNKRFLGDLVQKMIATAKDPTDMFEDVPLDTRHYHEKVKPKFPVEWRMTEERRKELEEIRKKAFALDNEKRTSGNLVDGKQIIAAALAAAPERDLAPVMARKGAGVGPGPRGRAARPLR